MSNKSQVERSVSVQVKRRLYASIYKTDKALALFTGRPPLISSKYASTPLPLDISDEELMGRIPPSSGNLDQFGWNTEGKLYMTTMIRARFLVLQIGERLLELMLQEPNCVTEQSLLFVLGHFPRPDVETFADDKGQAIETG